MEKLQRLQELIKLTNDGLSKEEFISNFQVVVDIIKKLQTTNKNTMDSLDTKYTSVVNAIKNGYNGDMRDIKQTIMEYCVSEVSKVIDELKERISELKDGEKGKDADEVVVAYNASKMALDELIPLIPTIDAIEKDLPRLGEPIRDSLELLKGDERLDYTAIKGIEELFSEVNSRIQMKNNQIGGQVGHQVMVYDLSSRLNGVDKVFSLPSMWRIISIQSSSFPNAFRPTTDYTYDAGTHTLTFTSEITASSTLASGQTITIIYST